MKESAPKKKKLTTDIAEQLGKKHDLKLTELEIRRQELEVRRMEAENERLRIEAQNKLMFALLQKFNPEK